MEITKGYDGWQATSTVPLDAERHLKISTSKSARAGLVTMATAVKLTDTGYTFVMFEDFSNRVGQADARCTEKTVALAHAAVMAKVEEIKADALAYYKEMKIKS